MFVGLDLTFRGELKYYGTPRVMNVSREVPLLEIMNGQKGGGRGCTCLFGCPWDGEKNMVKSPRGSPDFDPY